ncbi:MAG: hypothetical protein GDYSWBUE_000769 [Candidatus Fervidibacterota bacterium]
MALCTVKLTPIELPEEHWNAITCLSSVSEQLNAKAYIVGGFVRDLFLGIVSDDIDIAVSADPFAYGIALANALGGKFVPLHEEPKTARVVKRCCDRVLQVDMTAIRTTLEDDLLNRDFTVNSMAIPVETIRRVGKAIEADVQFPKTSPCYYDLIRRIIRMHSGLEAKLINDDPVRMLRAFRFAATLGFGIHDSVLNAIKAHSNLILRCSWERIRDEFALTLQSQSGSFMISLMNECNLLSSVLPEVESLKLVPAEGYHHLDGFGHSVEALKFVELLVGGEDWIEDEWRDIGAALYDALKPYIERYSQPLVERRTNLFALKMAVLLHDIGKPMTMRRDENGDLCFFKHDAIGAELAEQICARFKLSKAETHLIVQAVRRHMQPIWLAKDKAPSERALRRFWMRGDERIGVTVILVSLADMLATRGAEMTPEQMIDHMKVLLELIRVNERLKEMQAYPKLISGHDVMRRYGISQGPLVGEALRIVKRAQIAGRVKTREDALHLLDEIMPQLLSQRKRSGSCPN